MERKVRWGILGCGNVTEKKSGPDAFNNVSSELVAVMRRDAAKAEDFATRHNVPRWFSDAAALVADADIDAVYIAAPPSAHLELARLVAAAKKPCIVEKPIARNLPESQAMATAFEAAGVPLFVAYYRRAYPRMQRLKSLLGAHAIGNVGHVSYRHSRLPTTSSSGWREDVTTSGGGHLYIVVSRTLDHWVGLALTAGCWLARCTRRPTDDTRIRSVDVGSHVLDLLDFLFGALQDVRGTATGTVRRCLCDLWAAPSLSAAGPLQ
jgi:1,5-anhydro-D-fructose reductase (1,5-anhydro-D-mannitol-forming)